MNIIVTTPKSQMTAATQEAEDAKRAGGGEYFRYFRRRWCGPVIKPGCRVYYVEDGYVRGFAVVTRVEDRTAPVRCETTGKLWPPGKYVFMDATTWMWIRPIPMRGFGGFKYAIPYGFRYAIHDRDIYPLNAKIEIVGGWLDPKPQTQKDTEIKAAPGGGSDATVAGPRASGIG